MGNTLECCCPAASTVKVYLGDNGHLLRFSWRPISSTKIMLQHPNYLLIYSVVRVRQTNTPEGRALQHRVFVRVVRPGDLLRVGQAYFLVYIPNQHRPGLAKYFEYSQRVSSAVAASPRSAVASPRSTAVAYPRSTAVASPRSSAVASPRSSTASPRSRNSNSFASSLNSPTASPLYSPTGSPGAAFGDPRSFWVSTATPIYSPPRSPRSPRSPLAPRQSIHIPSPRSGRIPSLTPERSKKSSTYIPSPLRGNTGETTRAVEFQQHTLRNSAESHRIQSPSRFSTPSKRFTLGEIFNENTEQNPNKLANIAKHATQAIQRNPNRSISRSPGRAMHPTGQNTPRGILYQNLQQRNPAHRIVRSPGRADSIGTQATMRGGFNQRPHWSSPYYLNKSSRRPTHLGPGQPNLRRRRTGA